MLYLSTLSSSQESGSNEKIAMITMLHEGTGASFKPDRTASNFALAASRSVQLQRAEIHGGLLKNTCNNQTH